MLFSLTRVGAWRPLGNCHSQPSRRCQLRGGDRDRTPLDDAVAPSAAREPSAVRAINGQAFINLGTLTECRVMVRLADRIQFGVALTGRPCPAFGSSKILALQPPGPTVPEANPPVVSRSLTLRRTDIP